MSVVTWPFWIFLFKHVKNLISNTNPLNFFRRQKKVKIPFCFLSRPSYPPPILSPPPSIALPFFFFAKSAFFSLFPLIFSAVEEKNLDLNSPSVFYFILVTQSNEKNASQYNLFNSHSFQSSFHFQETNQMSNFFLIFPWKIISIFILLFGPRTKKEKKIENIFIFFFFFSCGKVQSLD